MWTLPPHAFLAARWYSSWILFSACIPILIMYGVWGTLTLQGVLSSEASAVVGEDADEEGMCRGVFDWEPVESELDHIFCEEAPSLRAVSSIVLLQDGEDATSQQADLPPSPQLGVVQRASGKSRGAASSPDASPSKANSMFSMSHVYRYLGLTGREKHTRQTHAQSFSLGSSSSGGQGAGHEEVKEGVGVGVSMVALHHPMLDIEEDAGGGEGGEDGITERTGLLRKDSKQQ